MTAPNAAKIRSARKIKPMNSRFFITVTLGLAGRGGTTVNPPVKYGAQV
jgi:hypothetical protein